tara:strand:- start:223 stop:693 length:471 start_codon:yes stop_codon:yes gene_type:complete
MEECVIAVDSDLFDNLSMQLLLGSVIASAAMRKWKHLAFCFTLFSFYFLSFLLDCPIKAYDPGEVWRYFYWSLIDIVYLGALFFLVARNKAPLYALITSAVLEAIAIFCHIFRAIDIKLTDAAITNIFYSEVIALTNAGFITLAVLPLLCAIVKRN